MFKGKIIFLINFIFMFLAAPRPFSVSPGGDRGTLYRYVGYLHRRHGLRGDLVPGGP